MLSRILKLIVILALLGLAAFGWRWAGKPGLEAGRALLHSAATSQVWLDWTYSRKWRTSQPGAPRVAVIPLDRFEFGCKPGRDVPVGEPCPDSEALREVDLRQSPQPCTAMGVAEVSFEEYDHYVWSQRHLPADQRPPYPEAPAGRRGHHPVVNVSHVDALGYARWLSQKTGQTWRLPTEEEWEYAARAVHPERPGGRQGPWWWGDESPQSNGRADCNGCDARSDGMSSQVGSFKPNAFGLYDTVGNVSEWTSSVYTKDNRPAASSEASAVRVRRGGSWGDDSDDTRVFVRRYSKPDLRYSLIGFRVCRVSAPGSLGPR